MTWTQILNFCQPEHLLPSRATAGLVWDPGRCVRSEPVAPAPRGLLTPLHSCKRVRWHRRTLEPARKAWDGQPSRTPTRMAWPAPVSKATAPSWASPGRLAADIPGRSAATARVAGPGGQPLGLPGRSAAAWRLWLAFRRCPRTEVFFLKTEGGKSRRKARRAVWGAEGRGSGTRGEAGCGRCT